MTLTRKQYRSWVLEARITGRCPIGKEYEELFGHRSPGNCNPFSKHTPNGMCFSFEGMQCCGDAIERRYGDDT